MKQDHGIRGKDNARALWSGIGQIHGYTGEITASAHADGVLFEIEQEHAVDSYNYAFNCQALISWEQWDEMVAQIGAVRPEASE